MVWNLVFILIVCHFPIACVSSMTEVIFHPLNNGNVSILNLIIAILILALCLLFVLHLVMLVKTADRLEWERKQIETSISDEVPEKLFKVMNKQITKKLSKKQTITSAPMNFLGRWYYPMTKQSK